MMPNQVYILSDAIRTGKTTALKKWAEHTPSIVGFLSPDINGKRMFQNIETGELIPMETEDGDLVVGKYSFDIRSFKHVEDAILKAWKTETSDFIILDEIGPLEINRNQGFHKLLLSLQEETSLVKSNLLLVVRDYCLESFLEKYSFKNVHVIGLEELKRNFDD